MRTGIGCLCLATACLPFCHAAFVQTPESMLWDVWSDGLDLPILLLAYLATALGVVGIVAGVRGAMLLDAFLRKQPWVTAQITRRCTGPRNARPVTLSLYENN